PGLTSAPYAGHCTRDSPGLQPSESHESTDFANIQSLARNPFPAGGDVGAVYTGCHRQMVDVCRRSATRTVLGTLFCASDSGSINYHTSQRLADSENQKTGGTAAAWRFHAYFHHGVLHDVTVSASGTGHRDQFHCAAYTSCCRAVDTQGKGHAVPVDCRDCGISWHPDRDPPIRRT